MRSLNTRAGIELYDELIRVPLIFFGNTIQTKKKKIKNQVRHVDIFPTILDLVKIKEQKETDGQSLEDLINDDNVEEKEELPAYIEVGINLAQIIDKKKRRRTIQSNRITNFKVQVYKK